MHQTALPSLAIVLLQMEAAVAASVLLEEVAVVDVETALGGTAVGTVVSGFALTAGIVGVVKAAATAAVAVAVENDKDPRGLIQREPAPCHVSPVCHAPTYSAGVT